MVDRANFRPKQCSGDLIFIWDQSVIEKNNTYKNNKSLYYYLINVEYLNHEFEFLVLNYIVAL